MKYNNFPRYLLALVSASSLTGAAPQDVVTSRTLVVPDSPSPGRQVVDANYQSYSVEYSYMADYAGNTSHPNEFSIRMIQNLKDISGAYPLWRVGGSTQNRVVYNASQPEGVILQFTNPTDDQPSGLTIGPAWGQSFQQFPKGTQYIYGLSFYDAHDKLIGGRNGVDETVAEAKLAYDAMHEALYAFEIGNEVDGWPCGSRRPCNWTVASYVTQWNQYANAVQAAIGDYSPLFQGCAFEAPRHIGYNATPFWNVENAIDFGMNKTKAKTVADHDYMGANCDSTGPGPTIEGNVLNHTLMTSRIYYHDYLGNATAGSGIKYVLGETNSISCQGAPGISDVYAAALWSVDYVLYLASLKIERVHFHMGTPYRYSPWQPIDYLNKTAHVMPLYYGNMMTAKVFAGGNKQVQVLINETTFTAYAVYDAGSASASPGVDCGAKLESVVVTNMAMWNSTQPAAQRPYTKVELPKEFARAKVLRLTSPGVETAENITFAGRWVDDKGYVHGNEVVEMVEGGCVQVGAGEAVLVSV